MNDNVTYIGSKADDTGDAADWTPRQALMSLINKIDSGEVNIDNLIVAYETVGDDNVSAVGMVCRTPNVLHGVGLLTAATNDLLNYG